LAVTVDKLPVIDTQIIRRRFLGLDKDREVGKVDVESTG
jgi:hypothetical protein